LIKPFELTDEKFLKLYIEQMRDDVFHVSDEARTPPIVFNSLLSALDPKNGDEAYEIGDGGVMLFRGIVDGFKCYMCLIITDITKFGPTLVREARDMIVGVATRHKLRKIEAQTADERIVKLAHLSGFETEGYMSESFLRGGERYGVTLLSRFFGKEE
jgi:hypothetical protein